MFALSKPTVVFCTDKSQKNVLKVVNEFTFVKTIISFDDAVDQENEILQYSDLIKNSVSFQVEEDVDLEDQVALILNSSGTTGLPKGVMFTYKMLRTNLVHARSGDPDVLYMKQKEVVPAVLPMLHVYGVVITNAALFSGATLAIFDHFEPTIFLQTIQKYKMEQLMLVPTLINFIANNPLIDQYDLSSVKQVWTGGSQLLEEDSKTVWSRRPHFRNRKEGSGRVSCGFRVKITHPETGRKLPAGQTGEICIGGAVTKGYLNDPQKTKEAIDAEGFIHSGDIGYYDLAGTIYVVGRSKDIIKYKSYQVSPVELETILVKHPQIEDAAVVGKMDRRFGEVPVGFIVKREDVTLTEGQVCDFVATFVSVEKRLHGGVRFVDVIPRNSMGKISRCELTKYVQDEFIQNE
ncbi:luciferin 4-monooxygenase-like [Tenebrio molitor]|uniref:luciferin 4-monooxygenase-like n=1 Tax=Tenebrio molitor TaxID=7067 RepID=UPI003624AAB2